MIREIHHNGQDLKFSLPTTLREVLELRVYINGQAADDAGAYLYLVCQWLGRYAVDIGALEFVQYAQSAGIESIAALAESVCLHAELPTALDEELQDRLSLLFEIDPDADDPDPGPALEDASPWVLAAARLSFAVSKDGPSILDMPPWASQAVLRFREVEAVRNSQTRDNEEAVRETLEITNRLGMRPASEFNPYRR